MSRKSVSHLVVVEQPSVIDESRDAFIELGAKRFRVKPTVAKAFNLFRSRNNYSKIPDALNCCLEDALRVKGFLKESTLANVVVREGESEREQAQSSAEKNSLGIGPMARMRFASMCLTYEMSADEMMTELMAVAGPMLERFGVGRRFSEVEEVEEKRAQA